MCTLYMVYKTVKGHVITEVPQLAGELATGLDVDLHANLQNII